MPLLEDFVIIFNNFKNHFPTGPIGKIPASDPDKHDELKYRFIGGNRANILRLDQRTGYITLDSRLNSDVPTNATLQVSVSGKLQFFLFLFIFIFYYLFVISEQDVLPFQSFL